MGSEIKCMFRNKVLNNSAGQLGRSGKQTLEEIERTTSQKRPNKSGTKKTGTSITAEFEEERPEE